VPEAARPTRSRPDFVHLAIENASERRVLEHSYEDRSKVSRRVSYQVVTGVLSHR
jgi:hypothetical protein